MALLKRHIRASTLLETLVALVLILICFSIATLVLVNIMQSDNGRLKLHARLELDALYEKTMDERSFVDGSAEYNGFVIEKRLLPYEGPPGLYLLELKAVAQKQTIATYKKLILVDRETP